MKSKYQKWSPIHLFALMSIMLLALGGLWVSVLKRNFCSLTALLILTVSMVLTIGSVTFYFFFVLRQRLFWFRTKLGGDEPKKPTLKECLYPVAELDWMMTRIVSEDYNPYKIKMLHMQAEFNALQNQISPHFFYNTLETIRARALDYGGQDIVDIVEALAMMFRFRINRTGEMTTFREEMSYIDNYMLIQKYRFDNRYQFQAVYDSEDVKDCILPVLTLSPLVENAIVHGLEKKRGGGMILLRITATQSRVIITVKDNGVGMTPEQLEKVQQEVYHPKFYSGSRSDEDFLPGTLVNLNRRIHHYFGEGYGLHILSTEGVGTTVEVMVPRL